MRHRDEIKNRGQLDEWTVTSLAKAFLQSQLENYDAARRNHTDTIPPSLSSIAVGSILETLNTSSSPTRDLKTIAENLNPTTFKQLINDPRLSYQTLKVLINLHISPVVEDLDGAIFRNERYVRSRGTGNQDGKYLVRLGDLPSLIAQSSHIQKGKLLSFVRKDISKGGLEVLDDLRAKKVQIHATDDSFGRTFERITKGILNGLDWSHVFMAGGMALTTLLHTNSLADDDQSVKDPDIDLYIYGLGSEDANAKVQHIYSTWSRNLPPTARDQLVVKNAKTINFLTDYPNRRVQIVLKLLPSPTDILLNFDLDACAIGFDGSNVLMLPRFVRALETGYSVFTMDLIWGHHLGDRRATQESRVFKYANRGFGLRFLPSYARSIGDSKVTLDTGGPLEDPEIDEELEDPESYRWEPRKRYPFGDEPGLKTLKRIAYLGSDFVHRYYYGATPLVISYEQYEKQNDPDYVINQGEHADWREEFLISMQEVEDVEIKNRIRRAGGETPQPLMNLANMDGEDMHRNLPDGRRGLGNFELFMRHCEVWRLDAKGHATLESDSLASTIYDAQAYDDLPTYKWGPQFSATQFGKAIDNANSGYWISTRAALCARLNIPEAGSSFNGFATRRLRRQVHGPDLDSIMQKQITIPLIIPPDLEHYILHTLSVQYPDLPYHFTETPCLIPLHDPTTHDPVTSNIPSLHDTGNESGNFRYWVITNESMWAGQHRVMDEIAEMLWTFFHWLMQQSLTPGLDVNTFDVECVYHVARSFRRRIVLPEISEHEDLGPGLPSKREATLFRPWALVSPNMPDREFAMEDRSHPLFADELVRYPFEDELFWKGDKEELGEEEG
ncbi:MAG: hypothetical protein Q9164_005168 [Protoblastenia rupestris]